MPRNFECEQPNYRLERMPKALAALRDTVTRLLSKAVAGWAKTGGAAALVFNDGPTHSSRSTLLSKTFSLY